MSEVITDIKKQDTLDQNYYYTILNNGLKVMLISDMDADMSAGAICVGVGSTSDAKEYNGIAHFCEHMLFMGNKKYPGENTFTNYVSDNTGNYNGETTYDQTIFPFEVSNEAFPQTVEYYVHNFIDPIFNEGSLEREMKTVDNEYSEYLSSDYTKSQQLICSECINSEFNKFDCGNLTTLNKPEIRNELIKFFNKYYSSDNMTACFISNMEIDELKKIVFPLLLQINKIQRYQKPCIINKYPFDENNLKKLYKVVPINDDDILSFTWMMKSYIKDYKANPANYLISLFGHEGPNSLTSVLKKDNLITSSMAGEELFADAFSKFYIEFTLTEKGKNNWKEVILKVLKYVYYIKDKKSIEQWFYEEQTEIFNIRFDHKDKVQPFDQVNDIAKNLHYYDPRYVLCANDITIEHNQNIINDYLNNITYDNLNIYFLSQSFEDECELTEKWYNTKYSKTNLNEIITENDIINYKGFNHILSYPSRNPFLPKNFDLLPNENSAPCLHKIPSDDELTEIYYKKDETYKLPKVAFYFHIYLDSEIHVRDIKYDAMEIIIELINEELSEIKFMANECDVTFDISYEDNAFILSVYGYSETILSSITEILDVIRNISFDNIDEKIKIIKDKKIKDYKNKYSDKLDESLYQHLIELLKINCLCTYEKIHILSKETFSSEDLKNRFNNTFNLVRTKAIIQGNITETQAKNLSALIKNKIYNNSQYLPKERMKKIDILKINVQKNFIYIFNHHQNPEENNCGLISYFQFGELNEKETIIKYLIYDIIKEDFYDKLRTKEAIGYSVYASNINVNDIHGMYFSLISNDHDPEFIWLRVTLYISDIYDKIFKNLSDDIFNTHVNSVINHFKIKYNDLQEETNSNYQQILNQTYNFDYKEKIVNILQNKEITKEDVSAFYKKHFIDNVRRLDIEYVPQSFIENYNKNESRNLNFAEYTDYIKYKREKVIDKNDLIKRNKTFSSPSLKRMKK